MPNLTGQSIGRYHILEQLGEGGMATVYKAYDTRLERNVAFKVLRTDLFGQAVLEQVLKRFEREAKSLAKLKHSNIVNILDFGEHEGMPYLVMEYLPGGTLKEKLGHVIPWQEAIHTLIPVARGLAYAHQHGVIHRDVKPANVLIDQNEEPILTDFGIAKLLEGTGGHTLTGSGIGIGTPEYMAPEQGIGASTIDARADIYSLGIVLYEMVTGRKPYIADTPMAVVLKQMTDPLPRPTDFVPDLPEEVEHILLKALAKEPNDRYADMNSLIGAMEGTLAGSKKIEAQVAEADIPIKRVKKIATPRAKSSPKAIMAIVGVAGVILVVSFGAPWVMKQFSVESEVKAISTKTLLSSPTSTLALPLSSEDPEPSPSPSPTKPSSPTSTATVQSNQAADPILTYIPENPPTFKDDFSTPNLDWGSTSEGFLIYSFVKSGNLTIEDHWATWEGLNPDYHIPGLSFPINNMFSATNFALEFDFGFEGSSNIGVQFRSSLVQNTGYKINIKSDGLWTLTQNGETIINLENDTTITDGFNTLLIIAYGKNLAIYSNDNILYEDNDLAFSGTTNKITVEGNYENMGGKFDNFKFWNLDGIKLSESTGAFYEPILSYLAEGHTAFQDDFSSKDAMDTNGGVWDPTDQGSIWGENGYRVVKKNEPSVEMIFPQLGQFNATDFAIQYDAAFVGGNPLDGFGIYFRASSDQKTNYKIIFPSSNRSWILSRGNGITTTDLDTGTITVDPYEFNTYLIIVKQGNLAIFVNGDLIVERNDIEASGIYNLFVATSQESKRQLKFDNVKFWNLNEVDFK